MQVDEMDLLKVFRLAKDVNTPVFTSPFTSPCVNTPLKCLGRGTEKVGVPE